MISYSQQFAILNKQRSKAEKKAERYKILLINALVLLEENGFGGESFAIEELGMTHEEYKDLKEED